MVSTILLAAAVTFAPSGVLALQQDEPAIRISTNRDNGVDSGDDVRVYVRTENDGHLVIFHADPEGRVRVLFPIDPTRDNFIRGGRDFEVRSRQDREAFLASNTGGLGVLYAAYSRDPFEFAPLVTNGHWDFRQLNEVDVIGNEEVILTELTQQVSVSDFDYDVVDYFVRTPVRTVIATDRRFVDRFDVVDAAAFHSTFGFSPFSSRFRFGIGFGHGFSSFGFGFGSPFFFDPFFCDPFFCSSFALPRSVFLPGRLLRLPPLPPVWIRI